MRSGEDHDIPKWVPGFRIMFEPEKEGAGGEKILAAVGVGEEDDICLLRTGWYRKYRVHNASIRVITAEVVECCGQTDDCEYD
jgi:hypothetical protein